MMATDNHFYTNIIWYLYAFNAIKKAVTREDRSYATIENVILSTKNLCECLLTS